MPSPFAVFESGGNIVVRAADASYAVSAATSIVDDDDGRTVEEKVATAARATLSGIQDALIELLQEPWPPTGAIVVPPAEAFVEHGALHMSYGDHALAAVPIDELDE